MKKSFIKVLGGVAFASMMLTACGATNYAANNTTFKIGVTGPLTGGAAAYGLGVKNAATMAVSEINEAGGVNGKLFSFEAMDDQLDAAKAGQNYTALYEKGMQMSLGGVTSGACLEFARYAAMDNVFVLTPSATNDQVPTNANTYQMCFSDSGQGTAAANYIKTNYADRTLGVFYDSSDAYSKGIYDNFLAEFGASGFTAAAFTSDNKTNFTAQINTLKNAGVNFVFMPIYYSEAALFIKQAAQADAFSADTIYYGCDGLDGIEGVENFDVYDYEQEISYLSHFNKASTDTKVQEFVANYTEAYGAATLNQFGAAAYDCVYAMYEALLAYEAAGNEVAVNTSAQDMCAILNSMFTSADFSFDGVTGSDITWTSERTVAKEATKYVVNG